MLRINTFNFLFIILLLFAKSLQGQEITEIQMDRMAQDILKKLSTSSKVKNIAVYNFTDIHGQVTTLGKYIAEEFSFALINGNNTSYNLIDRSKLKVLLDESGIDALGLLDPSSTIKLGRAKGLDGLIYGTITDAGDYYRVIIKIIQLETGINIGSIKGNISKTPTIILAAQEKEKQPKVKQEKEIKNLEENDNLNPQNYPKFKKGDLLFSIEKCTQIGSTIECVVIINNNGYEKNFTTTINRSTLIDSKNSNEYPLTHIRIANKNSNRKITKSLLNNSSTKAIFSFENIPAKIEKISKLTFQCSDSVYGSYPVSFRAIKPKKQ